ncbi:MAG: BON domain-containing protein [Erythrobacter sp.]
MANYRNRPSRYESDKDYGQNDDRSRQPRQFQDDRMSQFGDDNRYGQYGQYGDQGDTMDQRGYGRAPDYNNNDDSGHSRNRGDYLSSAARNSDDNAGGYEGGRGQYQRQPRAGRWGGQINHQAMREDQGHYYGDQTDYFYEGDLDRDRNRNRRHSRHDRDDRGFFDKAGDEVASWFGDDAAERRRMRDHRGRGPANYKRSNERLLEDACERLTHDPRIDARQINVTADNNEVTLDGTVESRYEKRQAEDIVHDISGVKHVQNNLRIADRDQDYDAEDRTTANRTKASKK